MTSLPFDSHFSAEDADAKLEALFQKLRAEFQRIAYNNVQWSNLSPSQIILDEEDVQSILRISKRKFAALREQRMIGFSQPVSNGKVYCTYQDLLDYINKGRVKTIDSRRRIWEDGWGIWLLGEIPAKICLITFRNTVKMYIALTLDEVIWKRQNFLIRKS